MAQQSTIQQPIYLASTTGATWPSNIFSQFNLANLSTTPNTNVSATLNPGTSPSQTVYEVPAAVIEPSSIVSSSTTIPGSVQSTGQQLYWPTY